MIVPYAFRLICLCLAAFFLIHLALCAAARVLAPWALRRAEWIGARRPASSAARLMLAVRLLPAALALAIVAGLCLPSFIDFEGERGAEAAGIPFLAAAALGAAIWSISLTRSIRALIRSRRYMPRRSASFASESETVWLWEGATPFVGLAGVLRPRVVVSPRVASELDSDQLAAALRHERAHRSSADNFKRLLLLLAPEPFPGIALFRSVDRAWARFAEWAADDLAVAQDVGCSVSLAEALVRVARLGASSAPSPLVSRFAAEGDEISSRVDRLLRGPGPSASRSFTGSLTMVTLAAPFVAAICIPGSLSSLHELLERLMH